MAHIKKPSQQPKAYINPKEILKATPQGPDAPREIDTQRRTVEQNIASSERKKVGANPEFTTLFTKVSHYESSTRESDIENLRYTLEQLRSEVRAIKAESSGLTAEIESIEKAVLQNLPNSVGIYHVRYYELILRYLRNVRAKVSEARTWLMAVRTKKARGYAANSKTKGSSYSQSQELQVARSVG